MNPTPHCGDEHMKRIALISADSLLRRAVALTLECAGAEVVLPAGTDDIRPCDMVVVLGAAGFLSGRFSAELFRRGTFGRPEIFVISWQHSERTVLDLLECGVDQYMTFPICLGRLMIKAGGGFQMRL